MLNLLIFMCCKKGLTTFIHLFPLFLHVHTNQFLSECMEIRKRKSTWITNVDVEMNHDGGGPRWHPRCALWPIQSPLTTPYSRLTTGHSIEGKGSTVGVSDACARPLTTTTPCLLCLAFTLLKLTSHLWSETFQGSSFHPWRLISA